MSIPILRMLIPLIAFFGLGCQTTQVPEPVAPDSAVPVLVFESLPPIQESITSDSPNAALRYLALRDAHPISKEEIGAVDLHLASFRMHDWDHEAEMDPVSYRAFLVEQQRFLGAISAASGLDRYDMQPGAVGYYGIPDRDDPRNLMVVWMGNVRRLLRDDAIRAWVEGDHKLAVARVETMVRIAQQMSRSTHTYTLDNLVSLAWAAAAIDLLGEMSEDPGATKDDRDRIVRVLELLAGPDPLSHLANMRRVIASYDQLVATELRAPDGGLALWRLIGEIHAVDIAIDELLRPLRDTRSAMSGDEDAVCVTGISDADRWTALIDSIIEQLDGITIEDLRRSYRETRPSVELALAELSSDNPDIEVFARIQDAAESDETGIPDILHLTVLRNYVDAHNRMLRQRDKIHADLTG